MTATLVDSNVILDVLTEDRTWGDWSRTALAAEANQFRLVIDPIIFAEVSVGFDQIEALESALPQDSFEREDLPWEAAFLAGKCFVRYRRQGGLRRSPLPDFFIGAHAAVRGYRLLTRDPRRYRSYFPTVKLVSPDDPSAGQGK